MIDWYEGISKLEIEPSVPSAEQKSKRASSMGHDSLLTTGHRPPANNPAVGRGLCAEGLSVGLCETRMTG
jgi:hypothetical protein